MRIGIRIQPSLYADPDADRDPDFYMMRSRFFIDADADPYADSIFQFTKMMRIHADPDSQLC
jgi:hypothetical protein